MMLAKLVICLTVFASIPFSAAAEISFSDSEFEQLCSRFSEAPGRFDSDNLITNESSFLHVVPFLRSLRDKKQVYIGVGPDQNFSYIAQVRPRLAVILDIRRDNRLYHLYLKELFRLSSNRWEFLSRLFGRPLPEGFQPDEHVGSSELAAFFRSAVPDAEKWGTAFEDYWEALRTHYPALVTTADREVVYRIASNFFQENLQLKYRSHGRMPRPYYPSFEQLMLETDLEGSRAHYLEREETFQFIKDLHSRNQILLLMGDFAGEHALRRLGEWLSESGYTCSVFYLSNVEFYLFRYGVFPVFVENLKRLPFDEDSILIRSYFSYWQAHPEAVPGYFVTSLAYNVRVFLSEQDAIPFKDYWDVVTRDYMPMPILRETLIEP